MVKPKKKTESSKSPLNDMLYTVDELYREENKTIKPQKNSLAELIFKNKHKELEKKLLESLEEIHTRDESGNTISWTPLYWAVKFRHVECVKVLLKYGASINTVVTDLEECCGTVLDLAMLRDDEEMESLLRESIENSAEHTTNSPFKAIRTKLRGKAPAFNFAYYGKKTNEAK